MNIDTANKNTGNKAYSLPAKTAAVIAFVLIAIITALYGIAFFYMCFDGGFYGGGNADDALYSSDMCFERLRNRLVNITIPINEYFKHEYIDADIFFSVINTDLNSRVSADSNVTAQVEIFDDNGNLLYTFGKVPDSYGARAVDESMLNIKLEGKPDLLVKVVTSVFLRKPLSGTPDEFTQQKEYFDFLYSRRIIAPIVTVLGAVASVSLFVYLMKAAGRRYGEEGVREGIIDRIPYDLLIIFITLAFIVIAVLADDISFHFDRMSVTSSIILLCTVFAAVAVPVLLLVLTLAYTTSVRIKTRSLLKNTLIWRLCSLAVRIARRVWERLKSLCRMLPAVTKAAILVPTFLFFDAISIAAFLEVANRGKDIEVFVVFLFLAALNICAFETLIRMAYELVQLRQGSSKLAEGDLEYKFDSRKFHGELKKITENLGRVSDGMAKAVEARSKSERMKVELITNVSHDLKTPITSIINYVDLLKKEPMQTDAAAEYLQVLDRQAQRLRKLTADLIEASKASTGNIEVKLEPTDICELIDQSAAEYSERFAAVNLTPVIRTPGRPINALADGRQLWRVIDNLLSNVCKYSMQGTRVYIDATCGESMATVTIRNISAEPLGGIDPEELTERFVRGDSARSGEGSGLGLSIARSLTELQRGRLNVSIDGDMFKVTITIPLAPA